ncbi:hypothetical protein L9F63_027838, partial [Diploptera punctata]
VITPGIFPFSPRGQTPVPRVLTEPISPHTFTQPVELEYTTPLYAGGCDQGWSKWYNTPRIRHGDYENLDSLEKRGELPCLIHQIVDIECKFFKNVTSYLKGSNVTSLELLDFTESGERVICQPNKGLQCNNGDQTDRQCEDYMIRVFCSCEGATVPKTVPPFTPVITEKPTTPELTTSLCPDGEVWGCIIPCSQLCSNFEYKLKQDGYCLDSDDCITGCINQYTLQCGPESLWRDKLTCVESRDCMCVTPSGKLVKPGIPVNETDCEVCQCINNQIECDDSDCKKILTTQEILPTRSTTLKYVYMTQPTRQTIPVENQNISSVLPESTTSVFEILFSSMSTGVPHMEKTTTSTTLGRIPEITEAEEFETEEEGGGGVMENEGEEKKLKNYWFIYLIELTEPRFKFSSRQHNLPNGIWKPQHNVNEYLQVDLGQQEPIYGSVVWGSHKTDEYVTSYNVLYSNDGKSFSYVLDARGENAIFRGPADPKSKVEQYFHKPVEARYMKWIPLTWHKHIAMKVELIGCKEIPTTYEFTTTSVTPFFTQTTQLEICQDAMGLQTGILSDQQISASSVLNNDIHKFGPSQARLNNAGSWVPKPTTFGTTEWIQFDFLEPRNLTGVITQGDVNLDSWIIKFAIQYSHDGAVWNPILETGQKTKK